MKAAFYNKGKQNAGNILGFLPPPPNILETRTATCAETDVERAFQNRIRKLKVLGGEYF
jgi:hypothetical protein